MKLGNKPVIKIYDKNGVDITTGVENDYEITYSSDATNASDYIGATYTTNMANATMIRVINTLGIQP
jgi:hypothetical protein